MGLSVDVQDDNILEITKNDITTTTASRAEFGSLTLWLNPEAFLSPAQLKLTQYSATTGAPSIAIDEVFSLRGIDSTSNVWDKNKMLYATISSGGIPTPCWKMVVFTIPPM
jgi:hypothetical protein